MILSQKTGVSFLTGNDYFQTRGVFFLTGNEVCRTRGVLTYSTTTSRDKEGNFPLSRFFLHQTSGDASIEFEKKELMGEPSGTGKATGQKSITPFTMGQGLFCFEFWKFTFRNFNIVWNHTISNFRPPDSGDHPKIGITKKFPKISWFSLSHPDMGNMKGFKKIEKLLKSGGLILNCLQSC